MELYLTSSNQCDVDPACGPIELSSPCSTQYNVDPVCVPIGLYSTCSNKSDVDPVCVPMKIYLQLAQNQSDVDPVCDDIDLLSTYVILPQYSPMLVQYVPHKAIVNLLQPVLV